jgi:hypothetical protein
LLCFETGEHGEHEARPQVDLDSGRVDAATHLVAVDDPEDRAAQMVRTAPVRLGCTGAPISAPRPVVRAARDRRRGRS